MDWISDVGFFLSNRARVSVFPVTTVRLAQRCRRPRSIRLPSCDIRLSGRIWSLTQPSLCITVPFLPKCRTPSLRCPSWVRKSWEGSLFVYPRKGFLRHPKTLPRRRNREFYFFKEIFTLPKIQNTQFA